MNNLYGLSSLFYKNAISMETLYEMETEDRYVGYLKLAKEFAFKSEFLLKIGSDEEDYVPSAWVNSIFYKKLKQFLGIDLSDREIDLWVSENFGIIDENFLDSDWLIFGGNVLHGNSPNGYVTYDVSKGKFSNDFKTITEAILTGVGRIPRLYFYIKDLFSSEVPNTVIDKKIAHDRFLIEALEAINSNNNSYTSEPFYKRINKFYKDYSGTIMKIKGMFAKTPEILGSGADGTAFDIGNGKVLKIYSDHSAYNSTVRSMEMLHSRPDLAGTEAMIYDVGILGIFNRRKVYYTIVEKTNTMDLAEDKNAIEFARKMIVESANIDMIRELKLLIDMGDDKRAKELAKRITADICLTVQHDYEFMTVIGRSYLYDKLEDDWLEKFVYEIVIKMATGRFDLHAGNLGISNKQLRYFDPSYSYGDKRWDKYLKNKKNEEVNLSKVLAYLKMELIK